MFIECVGRPLARKKIPVWVTAIRILAGSLALLFLVAPASADELPLTLGEAERLAVEQEPGERALNARADALAQRANAAEQLPVPQWRAGIANYPLSGGGFDQEPMTMAQVGFQQMMPAGDSRRIRKQLYLAESTVFGARASGRTAFVRESARVAWLDVYHWHRAEALVAETRPWLEELASVVRSHYEAGHKGQQDLVRAELELAKLDLRLIEIRQQESQARVRLSRWLGDAAYRPIAQVLPQAPLAPDLATLQENLRSHPEVLADTARVDAGDEAISLAREKFKAAWSIGVTYGYRSGRAPDGGARSDMVSLQVTRDLPFLGRKQQNSELAAALQERRASEAELQQNLRQLSAILMDAFTSYSSLDARIRSQQDRVLPLATFSAEAALVAYQSDSGDFNDLARARVQVFEDRLELVRLQVAQAKAYATLVNLGGAQS